MTAQISRVKIVLIGGAVFCVLCAVLFLGANWSAYQKVWSYQPTTSEQQPSETTQPTESVTPGIAIFPPAATPKPTLIKKYADGIGITKLALSAPIIWDVPYSVTSENLMKGVTHVSTTAHPGEIGNLVLFGHSSDYFWKRNPYATVFTLLPKLTTGDRVSIWRASHKYVYRVEASKIIAASDVSVLEQGSAKRLTLITCFPIGTTWERFVVQAVFIE